jgi:DNA-binding CsgD family transcriptional regulator
MRPTLRPPERGVVRGIPDQLSFGAPRTAGSVARVQAGLWFDAIGVSAGVVAALAVARRPESRRMALLIGWWLAISLALDVLGELPDSRVAVTLLLPLLGLQAPAFAHMALAYPAGAVRDRPARAFLAAAYPFSVLAELPPALFADFRCAGCSPHVPSLLFTGTVHDLSVVSRVVSVVFIALGLAFLALVGRRLRGVPPGARRTLVPLGAAAVFASAQFIGYHAASLAAWGGAFGALDWMDRLTALILPLSILYGLAAIRRGVLGDLVVALGATEDVRAALARAVGDPSLELVATGTLGELDLRGRAVRRIGPDLAIVHDEALSGQTALLEAAGAAARLALDSARLRRAERRAGRLEELTPRELEVLALMAEGLTDRAIGERLWLTPRTVETHVRHILSKLGLPADASHNRRVLAVLTYLRTPPAAPLPRRSPTARV